MDRRKLSWITWVFVVLTVLVLVMMLMDTLHGPDGMVLPDTSTTSGQTGEIPTPDGALAVVEAGRGENPGAAGGISPDRNGGAALVRRQQLL